MLSKKSLLIFVIVCVILSSFTLKCYLDYSSDKNTGDRYYEKKNYQEAFKSYKKAADEGNSDAIFKIGIILLFDMETKNQLKL